MSQKHVPNTFVFKQLASLRKFEELTMKFEQTQISRKLAQAASHRKLAVKRGTIKRAQAENLQWFAFSFDKGLSLTIGQRALVDNEGELSNCFSINQLVLHNIILK